MTTDQIPSDADRVPSDGALICFTGAKLEHLNYLVLGGADDWRAGLKALLQRFRRRGISGHWRYDVGRHRALLRLYVSIDQMSRVEGLKR